MKKMLSALLVALLLFCAALPLTVSAKAPVIHTPEYLRVMVNSNASKRLLLDWSGSYSAEYEEIPSVFEIYRSETGKSGTYKKIATTKKETYNDSGLKNGTVYYYKVRGYLKKGDNTYYSKFVKGCGCTKLTNNQATKLLQKAYRMAGMWMDLAQPNCNEKKVLILPRTYTYPDGTTWTSDAEYYLVTNKTISTKKQLKKYLGKLFDQKQVNRFVDDLYLEKNGKLWMFHFDWGDGASPLAQRDKVIFVSQGWNSVKLVNVCNWVDYQGGFCEPVIHDLEFRNGRWIFTDEYWFKYHHFIDLEQS